MAERKRVGDAGEGAVCRYLEQKGFHILARNYRAGHEEIDIIAENGRYLVFCEVKTRRETTDFSRFGRPSAAVNAAKRAHLLDAARQYIKETYGGDTPGVLWPRMDVAEVLYREEADGMHFRVCYIERAFGAGSGKKPAGGGWREKGDWE